MQPGSPSRTAQHNALFRALEQRLPAPLFEDPWAARFLRGRYRVAARLPAAVVAHAIDHWWPGPRAAVCVRTRWLDDAIARALEAGLDQLVILGAGFDARPYRLPGLAGLAVFEVDHPATQAMKRAVLGTAPPHVRYVPFDFAQGGLADALRTAGFRPGARTLFLWEGVTNYLDEASVDATLRFVSGAGTALLFTYVDRALLDGSLSFRGGAASLDYVRKLGEPFTYGLVPGELATHLRTRGLELVEDHALSALAERYYPGARPPVSAFYHVVSARCRG